MQLKDLQKKVGAFTKKARVENPPHITAMDLTAELGEVVAELLKSSKYGKDKFVKTEQLESEIGDLFYSLITLANVFNLDLERSLKKVLKKYEKRMEKGGEPGSKND